MSSCDYFLYLSESSILLLLGLLCVAKPFSPPLLSPGDDTTPSRFDQFPENRFGMESNIDSVVGNHISLILSFRFQIQF